MGRPRAALQLGIRGRAYRNGYPNLVVVPRLRPLEHRAVFLVEQRGADPERIALLTLTRSLVRSLADRVPYGRAQTLHSFALAQLNRLGDAWDRRVADPWEVENLVRTDLKLSFLGDLRQTSP